MPKIDINAAPNVSSIGPTRAASGADFGGNGAALQQAGQDITAFGGFLQKREEDKEMSEVRKSFSRSRTEWTQNIITRQKEMEAGGEGFVKNVLEDFNKFAQDGSGTFKTERARMAYSEGVERLRSDVTVRSIQLQADAVAKQQKQNYLDGVNQDGVTLNLDPTQFDTLLAERIEYIQGMNVGDAQKQELIEDAKQTYTRNAILGEIELNPDFALERINSGEFKDTITDSDVEALRTRAEQQIDANDADEREAEMLREKAEARAREETKNEFLLRMEPGAENPITRDEILKSDLKPEEKVRYLSLRGAALEAGPQPDPEVFTEVLRRVYLDDGDENKISDADVLVGLVNNGISMDQFKTLRSEIEEQKSPEQKVISNLKKGALEEGAILDRTNPLIGIKDVGGKRAQQAYAAWFYDNYEARVERGEDPRVFLNPASKDYIGLGVEQFKRTPEQIVRDTFTIGAEDKNITPPDAAVPSNVDMSKPPVYDKNNVPFYEQPDGSYMSRDGVVFGADR